MDDHSYGIGGRTQGALAASRTEHARLLRAYDIRRGTVLAVRYAGERDGIAWETTYDLIMHAPRQKLRRVPVLRTKAGYEDGDDVVLRAAFKSIDAAGKFDPLTSDLMKLDGDVVLVGFFDGDERQPVILGCLSHPRNMRSKTPQAGTRAKGERRFLTHKGTSVEIDQTGAVTLTVADGKPLHLKVSGAGEIVLDEGALKIARHTDPVITASAMAAWISAVTALLTASPGNPAICATPGALPAPTDFGTINVTANVKVKG